MRYKGGLGKNPGEKQLLRDMQIKMNHDRSREGAARERGDDSGVRMFISVMTLGGK